MAGMCFPSPELLPHARASIFWTLVRQGQRRMSCMVAVRKDDRIDAPSIDVPLLIVVDDAGRVEA